MRHAVAAASHSSGTGRRAAAAGPVLALLALLAACQPRQADPDPDAGDPPPAPVGARGDTLPSSGGSGAPAGEGGVRYPGDRPTGAGSGTPEIARLYREAYAIARAGGCSADGDCGYLPVGSKPCGGPWEYIVYCRLTTDTTRLRTVLAELERRQREHNQRNQMASTCEMILEPTLAASGGRCTARAEP